MLTFIAVFGAGVAAASLVLKVVAPRTKSKVDDRVLELLQKYGVPLAEYLQTVNKQSPDSRAKVVDHRAKKQ